MQPIIDVPPECFVWYLKHCVCVDDFKPGMFPKTQAFQDQVELNLDSVQRFWLYLMMKGHLPSSIERFERNSDSASKTCKKVTGYPWSDAWPKGTVYGCYKLRVKQFEAAHIKAKGDSQFWKQTKYLLGSLKVVKRGSRGKQTPHIMLPSLKECCEKWSALTGLAPQWDA